MWAGGVIGIVAVFIALWVGHSLGSQQGLSWEMENAPAGRGPEWRTYYWLQSNRSNLIAAEHRWKISRRAIAGVVAFEALEDVHPGNLRPFARYSGPGKVHYRESHLPIEGDPISKQVEDLGYLPRRTMKQRADILATDAGAIEYVGAIMNAFSALAQRRDINIRCNEGLLATLYGAWTLGDAQRLFAHKRGHWVSNDMGSWIVGEDRFLDNAIGAPTTTYCSKQAEGRKAR